MIPILVPIHYMILYWYHILDTSFQTLPNDCFGYIKFKTFYSKIIERGFEEKKRRELKPYNYNLHLDQDLKRNIKMRFLKH